MPAYNITTSPNGVPMVTALDGRIYLAGGEMVNCTLPVCPIELSTYGYRASLPFSALAIAVFALCAATQVFLGWRYKTWGFMTAMLLGCATEILGYAGRIMMWQNPWDDAGFIMQIVLITIGPVFFSAAIYVLINQIILYISPASSRFTPKLFYWVFIPVDIVSLILQAAGGAMSATSEGESDAGVYIALAGLALQVVSLVVFLIAIGDYMFLSRRVWRATQLPTKFKIFAGALILATVLILTRCCYRVYELSEGYSRESEALRDQPLFIALEGVMILAAACCLVLAHPGPVFRSGKHNLAEKESESQSESESQVAFGEAKV